MIISGASKWRQYDTRSEWRERAPGRGKELHHVVEAAGVLAGSSPPIWLKVSYSVCRHRTSYVLQRGVPRGDGTILWQGWQREILDESDMAVFRARLLHSIALGA